MTTKTNATKATPAKATKATKAKATSAKASTKASAAKATKAAARAPSAKATVKALFKIAKVPGGPSLATYTAGCMIALGMADATGKMTTKPVNRKMLEKFFGSPAIVSHHGGNGNFAVEGETVKLTAQGLYFFTSRYDAGTLTKADAKAMASAIKSGKSGALPGKLKGLPMFPHPLTGK